MVFFSSDDTHTNAVTVDLGTRLQSRWCHEFIHIRRTCCTHIFMLSHILAMGGEGGVGVDVRKACEQFTQESPTDRMSMIGA